MREMTIQGELAEARAQIRRLVQRAEFNQQAFREVSESKRDLRAEVKRLKGDIKSMQEAARHFKARYLDMVDENIRLKEALEVFADEGHWISKKLPLGVSYDWWLRNDEPWVVAREALEKPDEREERETS